MLKFIGQFWLVCQFVCLSGMAQAASNIPTGQLSTDVEPVHYQLMLKIDPEQSQFSGKTTIDIKVNRAVKNFYLHGQDLIVEHTRIYDSKGTEINAETTLTEVTGVLKVSVNNSLAEGGYKVVFEYHAPFNENLQGLHRVKDGNAYYAFTQMESIYARYAFPSFDEPRFKTPFDVSLMIPANLVAISNTPEQKTQTIDDKWKRVDFLTSKPLPTYLLAIAVGDFDVVEWQPLPPTDVRKVPVPLRGIATKGKGKGLTYALKHTQEIVEALEDYLQIPYPYRKLDLLAVPDFAAGAMENAGAITYREQLLLLDENSSTDHKRSYKYVQAHELAHQWFGDLVTPVWWNDIWLNEAFATWLGYRSLDRSFPDEQWQRQLNNGSKGAMNSDSIPSARKVRNPIKSNGDIITAFDGITYQKGSGVLNMIENFMGAENFRQGVKKYLQKYQWRNADAIDFFETIASVLEPERAEEVLKSFRDFVEQAGVPLLEISKACDDEKTQLNITQQRYTPLGTEFKEQTLWNIPACLSYEVDGEIKQQCELLAKRKQQITLNYSGCSDWVMPNAQASGYYRFNLDAQSWKDLLANLDKLDAQGASAVMDSLKAAYKSGNLSVQQLIEVIPATLNSSSWEVKTSGLQNLSDLIEYAEENEKSKMRKMSADLYRNLALSLGFVDNTAADKSHPLDTSKLRDRIIDFMALEARDADIRRQLVDMARQYIGFQSGGKLDDTAIIPTLRETAMAVAVQELGQPFVDVLLQHLDQSNDGTFRQRIIGALASTESPIIAGQMLGVMMQKNIRDNEKQFFLFGLIDTKALDATMWPWLETNFDALVAELPTNYQSYTPYLIANSCDQENLNRLDEFLKPRLTQLVGAESNFAKAKDRLKQCLALKNQLKPQIGELINSIK